MPKSKLKGSSCLIVIGTEGHPCCGPCPWCRPLVSRTTTGDEPLALRGVRWRPKGVNGKLSGRSYG
jgi:hypothetical protein